MERCPSCGVLRPAEGPCPGCLVELALEPPRWRWLGVGFAGGVLVMVPTVLLAATLVLLARPAPEPLLVEAERSARVEEPSVQSEAEALAAAAREEAASAREEAGRALQEAARAREEAAQAREEQARRSRGPEVVPVPQVPIPPAVPAIPDVRAGAGAAAEAAAKRAAAEAAAKRAAAEAAAEASREAAEAAGADALLARARAAVAAGDAEALQAIDAALARRTEWRGPTYIRNVEELYGLRVTATEQLHGPDHPATAGARTELEAYRRAIGR